MENNVLLKKYAIFLIFAFSACMMQAMEVIIGNYRYLLSTDKKEATILSCMFKPDTLDIPEFVTYNDVRYAVRKIATGAFPDNSATVKLSIPNSVVTIESGSFGNFSALRDIYVGSGVDSLSGYNFPHNKYIETYRINNQNILDSFCSYVRQGATSIETEFNMVVGDDIRVVGEKAFATNSYVRDFWMKTLTLGKSVTQINSSFIDCSFLEEVCVPSLLQWCNIQFKYTNGVNNGKLNIGGEYITDLVIPEGVEKINDHAFEEVRQLTSLTLPSTIKEIGDSAFFGCPNISSELAFPENIKIGKAAFCYGRKIKGITFPDNVASVGSNAFYDCDGLEYISVSTNTPNELLSCFSFLPMTNPITYLYLRGDLLSWMRNTDNHNPINGCQHLYLNGEEIVDLVIPEGMWSVYSSFKNCDGIRSVTFPASCNSISDNAFEGCDNIRTLYLTENMRSIGVSVFSNSVSNRITIHTPSLSAWMKIKFGNDWNWSSTLPADCNLVINGQELCEELVVPSDISEVQNGAFYRFKNINEIVIPAHVTSIGSYAFGGNENLRKVTVYSTVPPTCSGTMAFNYNSTLCVPVGSAAAYAEAEGWKYFSQIVEDESVSSLNSIREENNGHCEYFSVDGVKLESPRKGIVIVRDAQGRSRQVLFR